MSMQSLDIISVNIWQILISLLNLLLIFWFCKRFLFKRVQKVFDERKKQVDDIYARADQDRSAAESMRQEYETKLASAREEADGLVRSAVQTAQKRSDAIVAEANSRAGHLRQKAEEEIEKEKRQMLLGVKNEISDLAVRIASKVVEREINEADQQGFVDEFIRNVGDQQ